MTTTIAGTPVPADHLTTSIPHRGGTFWLYGFRAADDTARFTLINDDGGNLDVLFEARPWPDAYRTLAERLNHPEDYLHSVLPDNDKDTP